MNHSIPGLPVHHQLPEFTLTHVHWVSDGHLIKASRLQSFPASGSFQMSQFFASGGQSMGVSTTVHSASTSVLPMNIQDWFPLGLIALISLKSKGLSKVFFYTTVLHFKITLKDSFKISQEPEKNVSWRKRGRTRDNCQGRTRCLWPLKWNSSLSD